MFVVLEFNQASHQPRVWADTVHDTREEAEFSRDYARERLIASGSGRREEYEVAELTVDEPEG